MSEVGGIDYRGIAKRVLARRKPGVETSEAEWLAHAFLETRRALDAAQNRTEDSMPSKRMVPEQEIAELSDEIVRLHAEPKCDGGVPYVRLGEQCPKCGATADEGCRYTIPKLNAEIAALTEQRDEAIAHSDNDRSRAKAYRAGRDEARTERDEWCQKWARVTEQRDRAMAVVAKARDLLDDRTASRVDDLEEALTTFDTESSPSLPETPKMAAAGVPPSSPAVPMTERDKPSGWQDDPLEGAWWLTLFFRVWFFFDRR